MSILNPLLDKEFLKQLDNFPTREVYAKITALDLQDNPIEEITGKVTQGSINVDGASAVRRTCNLTLAASDVNFNDYYWGFKTKFNLEIGLKNFIEPKYPDIIWFKQGVYYITSFSCSQSTNNYSISINGKDKMCMLNGEMGGLLPASTYFGVKNVYNEETGETEDVDLLVYDIIKEAVHFYGKEPYHNIIINDLDSYGSWVLKYGSEKPMYLIIKHFLDTGTKHPWKVIMNNNKNCQEVIVQNNQAIKTNNNYLLKDLSEYDLLSNENLLDYEIEKGTKFIFNNDNQTNYYFTAIKIEYGENIGYDITELTYPDAKTLTLNAGETITALLDKIVSTFGDFEYFYDLDGRFVFQKKKTYLNTSWNNLSKIDDEIYADSTANTSACSYYFEDSNLITSFSNSPNFAEVKNDYVVWGERTSPDSNATIPIHLRYVIDNKPIFYHSITVGEEDIENTKLVKKTQIGHGYFTKEFYDLVQREKLNTDEDLLVIQGQAKSLIKDLSNNISGIEEKLIDFLQTNYLTKDYSVEFNNLSVIKDDLIEFNSLVDFYICQLDFTEINLHSLQKRFEDFKRNLENIEYFKDSDYLELTKKIMNEFKNAIALTEPVDWRELIYQMAADYYAFGTLDEFISRIKDSNYCLAQSIENSDQESIYNYIPTSYSFYETGYTGYEQYYLDLNGFWRQLYNYCPQEGFVETELKDQEQLFVKGGYRRITKTSLNNMTKEEKEKIMVLKANSEETNGEYLPYCFIPLIDLIPLQVIDQDTGQIMKNFYYIYKDESYYTIDNITGYKKSDLYIKQNNSYVSLIDYYLSLNEASSFTGEKTNWDKQIINANNIIEDNNKTIEGLYQEIVDTYQNVCESILFPNSNEYNDFFITNLKTMVLEQEVQLLKGKNDQVITEKWITDNCIIPMKKLKNTKKLTRSFNWDVSFKNKKDKWLDISKIKTNINKVFNKNIEKLNKTKKEINSSIEQLESAKKITKRKIKTYNNTKGGANKERQWKIMKNEIKNTINQLKSYRDNQLKAFYINTLKAEYQMLLELLKINAKPINTKKKSNQIQENNLIRYKAYESNTAEFDDYINVVFTKKNGIKEFYNLYFYDNTNIGYIDPAIYYTEEEAIKKMYYENNKYKEQLKHYSYNKYGFDYVRQENELNQEVRSIETSDIQYYDLNPEYYPHGHEYAYWHYNVYKAPDNLNFWFDFLDTGDQAGLNQFSVSAIGDRTKVDNNSKVVSIYYKDIPQILFLTQDSPLDKMDMPGYNKLYVTKKQRELFSIVPVGITAKEQAETMLYNYGYCSEAITLNTLPIYYLEPNTRISVKDKKTGIDGEYIMTKFTLPLTHNGTSSITATKAPKRII